MNRKTLSFTHHTTQGGAPTSARRSKSEAWLSLIVVGLVGVLASLRASRWLLQPLALVGRMALTHYLGQTVFSILFFFGFGLGFFGSLERYQLIMVAVAFWLVQILFSHWWLQRFRHGPLEWLWRSLSKWRWQPIRKQAPAWEQLTP